MTDAERLDREETVRWLRSVALDAPLTHDMVFAAQHAADLIESLPKNVVHVPPVDKPMSSLDGLSTIAIDNDAEANLYGMLAAARINDLQIVAVVPFRFFNIRNGYLVILFDKTKDPRYQP